MHFLADTLVEHLGIPENYAEHGGSVDHLIDVVHWFMLVLFVGWTGFFSDCLLEVLAAPSSQGLLSWCAESCDDPS
jgi:hypothetical protein